jgi:hypothetical protein
VFVPNIGVTGHVLLAPGSARPIFSALYATLRRFPAGQVHGITCLADGADRLFARAVLAVRGTYEVVLPARDYHGHGGQADEPAFRELLDRAAAVSCCPFATSGPEAYAAASEEMLSRCDLLIAVWDGDRSGGPGGTADVVVRANRRSVPFTVVWPAGARRTRRVASAPHPSPP